MSSMSLFLIFVPILALILLFINLAFASHNPYPEKNNVFECGFTSFLGQNRTQFSISFFIFALLFLLFDLEILLVYPYLVSAYTNETYGLTVILIFLLALTLGFAFELGKKALSIDSRQTTKTNYPPTPHALVNLPLQNKMFYDNMLRYYIFFVKPIKLLYKKVLCLFNFLAFWCNKAHFKFLKNKITYYLGVITKKVKLNNIINGLFITVCLTTTRYIVAYSGPELWQFLLCGLLSLVYRFTGGLILEHELDKYNKNINLYELIFGFSKSRSSTQCSIRYDSPPRPPSPNSFDAESDFPHCEPLSISHIPDVEPVPAALKNKMQRLPTEIQDNIKTFIVSGFGERIKLSGKLGPSIDLYINAIHEIKHYINLLNNMNFLQEFTRPNFRGHGTSSAQQSLRKLRDYMKHIRQQTETAQETLHALSLRRRIYFNAGLGQEYIKHENNEFKKTIFSQISQKEFEIECLRVKGVETLSPQEIERVQVIQSTIDGLKALDTDTFYKARGYLHEVTVEKRNVIARAEAARVKVGI